MRDISVYRSVVDYYVSRNNSGLPRRAPLIGYIETTRVYQPDTRVEADIRRNSRAFARVHRALSDQDDKKFLAEAGRGEFMNIPRPHPSATTPASRFFESSIYFARPASHILNFSSRRRGKENYLKKGKTSTVTFLLHILHRRANIPCSLVCESCRDVEMKSLESSAECPADTSRPSSLLPASPCHHFIPRGHVERGFFDRFGVSCSPRARW